MWSRQTVSLIEAAFLEDFDQAGDLSSALLPEPQAPGIARLVARRDGVVCGLALAPEICRLFSARLGAALDFSPERGEDDALHDGDLIRADQTLALVRGSRRALLGLERTLLNFLCRMSGVATLTRRFVEAARRVNPAVRVLDTRKTLPGWRELDRYAVRCGGGENHRMGLYDAVLIKDNHLAGVPLSRLATMLSDMLTRVSGSARFVEVEVQNLEQFEEVCRVPGVQIVMLDNFAPEAMRQAVSRRDALGLRGRLELEASGGVTLDSIASIAATGVERISVGALTHSAPALDLALDLVGPAPS